MSKGPFASVAAKPSKHRVVLRVLAVSGEMRRGHQTRPTIRERVGEGEAVLLRHEREVGVRVIQMPLHQPSQIFGGGERCSGRSSALSAEVACRPRSFGRSSGRSLVDEVELAPGRAVRRAEELLRGVEQRGTARRLEAPRSVGLSARALGFEAHNLRKDVEGKVLADEHVLEQLFLLTYN